VYLYGNRVMKLCYKIDRVGYRSFVIEFFVMETKKIG